jgi:hypothetical protein
MTSVVRLFKEGNLAPPVGFERGGYYSRLNDDPWNGKRTEILSRSSIITMLNGIITRRRQERLFATVVG